MVPLVRPGNAVRAVPVRVVRPVVPCATPDARAIRLSTRRSGPLPRPRSAIASGSDCRRWRRRGRRGQVAAIATLLSLLLIVVMMANYLATQLPAQMQLNDANHALAVEDQVSKLAASLRAESSAGSVGGLISDPVSLGSSGAAPFAGPDVASIGPGATGSQIAETFTVLGPVTYNGPGSWAAGGNLASLVSRGSCSQSPSGSQTPTSVNCEGLNFLTQNFTNGSHFITFLGAQLAYLNFTASYSTIVVDPLGATLLYMYVVGDHDNIYVNTTGIEIDHVTVAGNYDNISFPTTGLSLVSVLLVGSYDHINQESLGATSFTANVWGEDDAVNATETLLALVNVYFTGFNTLSPTSVNCPYANLSSTDTLAGSMTGLGILDATYNDTTYSGTGTMGQWSVTWNKVSGLSCPFFSQVTIVQRDTGAAGASFVVHLQNTYSPQANIAFDQGAVIYAQPSGSPLMLVPPAITYSRGTLSLWIPQFQGKIGTEQGAGTAVVSARLISQYSLSLPANGFSLGGSNATVTITTPYWGAWWGYFNSTANSTGLKGLASATCSLIVTSGSAACKGPYRFNGPLGKVTLIVPVSALYGGLKITVATYAVTVP